jgi:hypothetical protein
VDYNIDFGDVQTTLDLSPERPNMTWWAAEIPMTSDTAARKSKAFFSLWKRPDFTLCSHL